MKECKMVCFNVKSGEIKAVTNIESHFVNQKPQDGESIDNYGNGDYRIKRVVPLGSRSFFLRSPDNFPSYMKLHCF